jgi:DNA-binding XRE family transcriptional regulator
VVDRRRKPLTPYEQLLLREKMIALVAEHPEWEVPRMLKAIRKSLHLTIADMARVGHISEPALHNAEAGRSSPSLSTVDALLRPFGLKLAVVRVAQRDTPPAAPDS